MLFVLKENVPLSSDHGSQRKTSMKIALATVFMTLIWSHGSSASQFYIFPVHELDGISKSTQSIFDDQVKAIFTAQTQNDLLGIFEKEIVAAFPGSGVSANQVRDTLAGDYKYIDAPGCGEGFTAPLQQSYAAVVGVTRGAWYQVDRDGGRVEILIPITLNIQLIKPDLSKVVYAASETLYSSFMFSKAELGTSQTSATISARVKEGLDKQIRDLVTTLKENFKPKDVSVNVVGQEQGVLIVDQGFEVGFKLEDELQAANVKSGKSALFRVISVDSGYAVLKLVEGNASKGDAFIFTFESPSDDSRKPRVLPLTISIADANDTADIASNFSKALGSKSGFQLVPVDQNFSSTMDAIRRNASCASWTKYPSTQQVLESRNDSPDFFLTFHISKSPVKRQSGFDSLKTVETFLTSVTAQIVDKRGAVVFSEIGTDHYALEKTNGEGLSMLNAEEISQKNATLELAARFIKNVKFENGNFKISSVDKDKFNVEGLSLDSNIEPSYEILRPLSAKVNGKPTYMRVAVDQGGNGPVAAGKGTVISYSKIEMSPVGGDILRMMNMPRPGQERILECETNFKGKASITAEYLRSLVKHASYKSAKFQPVLSDQSFYDTANDLLKNGFFKLRIAPKRFNGKCLKSGYTVEPQPEACRDDKCSTKGLVAATLIVEENGERIANYVQGETVDMQGFAKRETDNFVGFSAYESVLNGMPKLTAFSDSKK